MAARQSAFRAGVFGTIDFLMAYSPWLSSAFSSYKFRYSLLGVRIPAAFKRMAALRSVSPRRTRRGLEVYRAFALRISWLIHSGDNEQGQYGRFELRKSFGLRASPNR